MQAHMSNFLDCMRSPAEADARCGDRRSRAGADHDGGAVLPRRPRAVLRREDLESLAEAVQGLGTDWGGSGSRLSLRGCPRGQVICSFWASQDTARPCR